MVVFDRESVPLAGKRGPSASTRPEPSRGLVLGPVKVPHQRPICWRNILINTPCLSHAHVHMHMYCFPLFPERVPMAVPSPKVTKSIVSHCFPSPPSMHRCARTCACACVYAYCFLLFPEPVPMAVPSLNVTKSIVSRALRACSIAPCACAYAHVLFLVVSRACPNGSFQHESYQIHSFPFFPEPS